MLVSSVNSDARCKVNRAAIQSLFMAKKRRELTQDERDEADRLRAIWDKRDPKISQLKFANDYEIGTTQGILWQYLRGRIPLNVDVAIKFARGLKCNVEDFSPRLEAERQRLSAAGGALVIPKDLAPGTAQEILNLSSELSVAQQRLLLDALKEAVEGNTTVKKVLKIPALRHPEDTEVAKALHKGGSVLRVQEDPERDEFERNQLPLFGTLRNPRD